MPSYSVHELSMDKPSLINIRVVYALAERQHQVSLRVPLGTTIQQAVQASGLPRRFEEIGPAPKCAVFSRFVESDYTLREGDRIEILRPLVVDPKDNRRKTAQSTRGLLRR